MHADRRALAKLAAGLWHGLLSRPHLSHDAHLHADHARKCCFGIAAQEERAGEASPGRAIASERAWGSQRGADGEPGKGNAEEGPHAELLAGDMLDMLDGLQSPV